MGNHLFRAFVVLVSIASLTSCKEQAQEPKVIKVPDEWAPAFPHFAWNGAEGPQQLTKAEADRRSIDADAEVIFEDKDIESVKIKTTCRMGKAVLSESRKLVYRKKVAVAEILPPSVWKQFELPDRALCKMEFVLENKFKSTRSFLFPDVEIRNFQKLENLPVANGKTHHTALDNGVGIMTTDEGEFELLCERFQNRVVRDRRHSNDELLSELIDGNPSRDGFLDQRNSFGLQSCRLFNLVEGENLRQVKISPKFLVRFKDPEMRISTRFELPSGAQDAGIRKTDVLEVKIANQSDANLAFRLNGLAGQNVKFQLIARKVTFEHTRIDEYTGHLAYAWSGQSWQNHMGDSVVLEVAPNQELVIRAKVEPARGCLVEGFHLGIDYAHDFRRQGKPDGMMDLMAGTAYTLKGTKFIERFVNWDSKVRDMRGLTDDLKLLSVGESEKDGYYSGWAPGKGYRATGPAGRPKIVGEGWQFGKCTDRWE